MSKEAKKSNEEEEIFVEPKELGEDEAEFELEEEPPKASPPKSHTLAAKVRPYLIYVVSAILIFFAFEAGRTYEEAHTKYNAIEELLNKADKFHHRWPSHFSDSPPASQPSSSNIGCDLFPDEAVCQALKKPGGEHITNAEFCFASPTDNFVSMIERPSECTELGPLGLIHLTQLSGNGLNLKAITEMEIPEKIRPHLGVSKGLDTRSALVTLLIVAKANGQDIKEILDAPEVASQLQYNALVDNPMSEDQLKAVGQMLSFYNGFLALYKDELTALKEQIKVECAVYASANSGLVPIRCLAVNPSDKEAEQSLPSPPPPTL